jgi:CheY-like chemotaxis protein
MKGHREEFLANGCSHYISKPFSSDSIKQMVFDLIEDGRS